MKPEPASADQPSESAEINAIAASAAAATTNDRLSGAAGARLDKATQTTTVQTAAAPSPVATPP